MRGIFKALYDREYIERVRTMVMTMMTVKLLAVGFVVMVIFGFVSGLIIIRNSMKYCIRERRRKYIIDLQRQVLDKD